MVRRRHLTLLGYRRDALGTGEYAGELRVVPGSGLGILRDESPHARDFDDESVTPTAGEGGQVLITTGVPRARCHPSLPPLCVAVRIYGEDGRVLAEHRFLGILTPGRSRPT